MRDAPPYRPPYATTPERLLTVRVPFEERELAAARQSFGCHVSQYTPDEMDAIFRALAHGYQGRVYLRPWYSGGEGVATDVFTTGRRNGTGPPRLR